MVLIGHSSRKKSATLTVVSFDVGDENNKPRNYKKWNY